MLLNMSINTSSFILLLLCLYFHACNARPLGATSKKPEKNFYLSTKNEEKVSPVELSAPSSKVKASLSNRLGAGNDQNSMPKESRVVDEADDDHHKPLSTSNPKELKGERVEISGGGGVQTESLASVSNWRMPHRKHGEHQPGFNLDYAPPKTHPPVHN